MTRQVLYVAHPVRPTEAELANAVFSDKHKDWLVPRLRQLLAEENCKRAMHWLDWLRRSFPETTFIAPWIAGILAGADDGNPAQREAGMRDNEAVIERCDGIVLCGGRISEGMRREMEHGRANSNVVMEYEGDAGAFHVHDLTKWEAEAPPKVPAAAHFTFSEFMRGVKAACG